MNVYYISDVPFSNELRHHGIKGQKWGIRRYQNEDGTLTDAGKKRYGRKESRQDLGYTRFQRLNAVQKDFVDTNRSSIKTYMKESKRASKTKNERKKAERLNEAKAFMKQSEMIKAMNTFYNSLARLDRADINYEYKKRMMDAGRDAALAYINNEMLRRKVRSDSQSQIWHD